ncbi:gamma-glutamyl-gamma-aminobutyrate hydrolase family protein [Patescibacteria group bacterium]|nr:gamma-glutamyl-gamma-aminobutyrate hydrolase family protein [Patescibacteria group bacterium]
MSPEILLIQFRRSEQSQNNEARSVRRVVGEGLAVTTLSALDEAVLWAEPSSLLAGYSGLIFGGSGDFDFDGGRADDDESKQMSYVFLERLTPLLAYVFEHDVPTFGICYGHQLLGAFAGVAVCSDPKQKKTRSHAVVRKDVHDKHPLLAGMPKQFTAHYGHKDVLAGVPAEAELLIDGGECCQVSALQYKNNIFSTQFHPELSYEEVVDRINNAPGYLPEGLKAEDLFTPDDCSSRMLLNFAALVAKHSQAL